MRYWLLSNFTSAFITVAVLVSPSTADQSTFAHYDTRFRNIYWSELYPGNGYEFYCGTAYATPTHAPFTPPGMSLEHGYAAQWMVEALGCGANRVECRSNEPRFGYLEADMHNLFPAVQSRNSSRGDLHFGMIPGEVREYGACDFERDSAAGIVEPRPITRGNFARAIFYMAHEYDLPIDADMLPILLQWNHEDLVNGPERRRNDKIEHLQGNRNPFIDNPSLADEVFGP